MKKISNRYLKLNKINISRLDTTAIKNLIGGVYETKEGQDTCTSSRFTVDISGNQNDDRNP